MSEELEFTVCGVTDVGVEREHNEDAFVLADARSGTVLHGTRPRTVDVRGSPLLLAVADGMGGENAGEVASALTTENLRTSLARHFTHADRAGALRAAILETHLAVMAASATAGREGMGATLVAMVVADRRAVIAWVGDSRAYLLRAGKLTQLTRDQSLLQRLIDGGSIVDQAQIASFAYKNVILQAIGRAPTSTLEVPVEEIDLERDDVVLLCTDGLSGELEDEAIRTLLMTSGPLDLVAARLVAHANQRGGRDNITVVLGVMNAEGWASFAP